MVYHHDFFAHFQLFLFDMRSKAWYKIILEMRFTPLIEVLFGQRRAFRGG